MAKKDDDKTKPTTAPEGSTGGALSTRTAAPPAGRTGDLPIGRLAQTLALEADASDEFAALAPTFGDVLGSIGIGVAESQAALDAGLVEAARTLSETKIEIVTDVVQKLDDDGLPVAEDTELLSSEVALINYLSPTVHEWKHVALSMDMSVGEMDNERGVTFTRVQREGNVTATGLFWGFLGWFDHKQSETRTTAIDTTDREADWARGQVRLDAMLAPRRTEKFTAPAQVAIGPQLYFSRGSVDEATDGDDLTGRSIDLVLDVRKADGSVNAGVNIDIDTDRFTYSFADTDGFTGSLTNNDGRVIVTVTRQIPNRRFARAIPGRVTARLGAIEQSTEVSL